MKKLRLTLCWVAALATAVNIISTRGQMFAVESYNNGGENGSASGSTYGWQFTVGSSDLSVTAIGLLDLGAPGFADSHQVGIWDGASNLAERDFSPTLSGTPGANSFSYQSVSGVTLLANHTYSIGDYSAGSQDHIFSGAGVTYAPDINNAGGSYGIDGGFEAPSTLHASLNGYVSVNFEYSVVPEPEHYALVGGLGLVVFATCRRYRMSRA